MQLRKMPTRELVERSIYLFGINWVLIFQVSWNTFKRNEKKNKVGKGVFGWWLSHLLCKALLPWIAGINWISLLWCDDWANQPANHPAKGEVIPLLFYFSKVFVSPENSSLVDLLMRSLKHVWTGFRVEIENKVTSFSVEWVLVTKPQRERERESKLSSLSMRQSSSLIICDRFLDLCPRKFSFVK